MVPDERKAKRRGYYMAACVLGMAVAAIGPGLSLGLGILTLGVVFLAAVLFCVFALPLTRRT